MPLSPGSISPQDTLVSPLVAALMVVCGQIAGLGNLYPEVPDAAPEDNSVLFAPLQVEVNDDETSGKLVLGVDIEINHLFRRRRLQENLSLIYQFLPAWLTVTTAYSNQTLGGLAQNWNVSRIRIAPYVHAGQAYLALVITATIRVVQNINQS